MDQDTGTRRSNIARPLSKLPLARGSALSTPEPSKSSQSPKVTFSRKPAVKPLGESNSARPSFGWNGRQDNGITSPTRPTRNLTAETSLDTTPPSARNLIDSAVVEEGNENSSTVNNDKPDGFAKRRPRPSLSERTIETLSQISPAPSPTRRRSSTVKSTGSMGPPARPASAMRNSRPSTPSTSSSGRAPSPMKRPFRPPGKPTTPAKEVPTVPSLESIYTPPRAFVRDHSSRIGRPTRDNRRSISTTLSASKDSRPTLKPAGQAVKVKSMYDIRAAASRSLSSKPSLPALAKDQVTPAKNSSHKLPMRDNSPQTGLMRARHPGENVLASSGKPVKPASNVPASLRKTTKQIPAPNQSQKRESSTTEAPKSSAALRDTIAKAKAAKKEELRRSGMQSDATDQQWTENNVPGSGPVIMIGSQSLKKKIDGAVVTGVLNLSAMSLRTMPAEVMTMYDFNEDNNIAWSEAVDLKKLLLADNDIAELSDFAFPDWSENDLSADPEKSNQFGGLEVLDLHGNNLSALPIGIRRLQQLRVLNLSNNSFGLPIFSPLSELTNLRELRLAKNGLSGSLPAQIGNMQNLQVLDLRDNQLDELVSGISELNSLQKLLLGGNRFSSISISSLPSNSLIELDLSRNMLRGTFATEEVGFLQKLQLLDVSFNSLETICTDGLQLPSLRTLSAHNNRLIELPDLSYCDELTTMTASENSISSISQSFYGLKQLRNVDLSNNSLKSINANITSMENLSAFNVAGNPLREKKYLTMNVDDIRMDLTRKQGSAETSEGQASTRQHAITGETSLVDEPQLMKPKQGALDLSSRNLSNIDPSSIDLCGPVHTIRLANNDLTAFPIELLMHPSVRWSLRSLDMSHNPLLHPVDYLTSELHLPLLQSLYIVSTGLTTLETLTTHLKAPELKELNISCHRLTGHIPWVRAWYPTITTLYASDNWFDSIDVEAVRGLEVLDISNNEVESLPPKLGLLGNHANKNESGRLRSFQCSGNRFRVPRLMVIERGTEATLKDLRRMIPDSDIPEEWASEI